MADDTRPSPPDRPTVDDPIHHVSYAFERDGCNLWVFSWFKDGAHLPEHFHPQSEERWEALDGALRVKLDGKWRDLRPEDGPVPVLADVRHELKNESGTLVRGRTECLPALHLEEFLVETAKAGQERLYNRHNLPTSWRGAVWAADLAQRFKDETVMTSPPPALQRVFTPLLARFAR
ncbi:MAG TPA: hypothetical protein VKA89_11335 [Solirubrobacterales bacterium]|nr:hypothetical protein [Solirubrobacterales bacterium]